MTDDQPIGIWQEHDTKYKRGDHECFIISSLVALHAIKTFWNEKDYMWRRDPAMLDRIIQEREILRRVQPEDVTSKKQIVKSLKYLDVDVEKEQGLNHSIWIRTIAAVEDSAANMTPLSPDDTTNIIAARRTLLKVELEYYVADVMKYLDKREDVYSTTDNLITLRKKIADLFALDHGTMKGEEQDAREFMIWLLEVLNPTLYNTTERQYYLCTNCYFPSDAQKALAGRSPLTMLDVGKQGANIVDCILQMERKIDINKHCLHCTPDFDRKHYSQTMYEKASPLLFLCLKLGTMSEVGVQTKNLQQIVAQPELYFADAFYELRAIIYHIGMTVNSGHYATTVKYKDSWFFISDEEVTPVKGWDETPGFEVGKTGYIYIYVRL